MPSVPLLQKHLMMNALVCVRLDYPLTLINSTIRKFVSNISGSDRNPSGVGDITTIRISLPFKDQRFSIVFDQLYFQGGDHPGLRYISSVYITSLLSIFHRWTCFDTMPLRSFHSRLLCHNSFFMEMTSSMMVFCITVRPTLFTHIIVILKRMVYTGICSALGYGTMTLACS